MASSTPSPQKIPHGILIRMTLRNSESDTRFRTSGFFHESVSPRPPSIPLELFWIFSKISGYIRENCCLSLVSTTPVINCSGVSPTPAKNLLPVSLTPAINLCHGFSVIAGVLDIGEQFITGDNDTGNIKKERKKEYLFIFYMQTAWFLKCHI